MKNFLLLKYNLNLSNIRDELDWSDLWVDLDTLPNRPETQAGSVRIQLRTNKKIPGKHYHDIHETRDLPAWNILSSTRIFVTDFANEFGGEIGHVRVTNLRGNGEIIPHIDVGEYCFVRDRFHLVINSPKGTQFTAGGETVIMEEGQLWWFDNKVVHSVKNLCDRPRTHLIFDLKKFDQDNIPPSPGAACREYK